jgi:CDP-glycerol glycerophosphotransferase (TagB/SpsB family)
MADKKSVLFFIKIECNFAVVERIYQRLALDDRLDIRFTSRNDFDGRSNRLFRRMGRSDLPTIHPTVAAFRRWDLYISPDILMMARRARFRIHTFHGVSFKGKAFTEKVLKFDRLFVVGSYMKRRFVEKGILAENDPRLAMVGMPKLDPLVDGTLQRVEILGRIGLPWDRPTVLYAPTWRKESSLYSMGEAVIRSLVQNDWNILVKLHDLCYYPSYNTVDWEARMRALQHRNLRVIRDYNVVPYLFAGDLLITDASSVGNEFTLLDRPILFLETPQLVEKYKETIDLETWGTKTGRPVKSPAELIEAATWALDHPAEQSEIRRAAAADIFHKPGTATDRAVEQIYKALELSAPN